MMVKLLVVMLAIAACLNSQVEAGACGCGVKVSCEGCGAAYASWGILLRCGPSDFKKECCDCDSG